MPTRIAYFVMVHRKPIQFEWLMQAIANPRDLFFVHVDLKSRLGIKPERRGIMDAVRMICAGLPNVVLLPSRFTNWGGWSLSRILLDTIALALKCDLHWTHFINLSGQCYPLKPTEAIRDHLERSHGAVHIEMLPISGLPNDDWHHRAIQMIETPVRAFKRAGRQNPPEGFEMLCKGSQWVILPREFCQWTVTAPVTTTVSRYLRRRLLSDELIMQTLVANSPYRDQVAPDYGREIIWPGPKVMTMADWPTLCTTPALFGRKFDSALDENILRLIAHENGFGTASLTT